MKISEAIKTGSAEHYQYRGDLYDTGRNNAIRADAIGAALSAANMISDVEIQAYAHGWKKDALNRPTVSYEKLLERFVETFDFDRERLYQCSVCLRGYPLLQLLAHINDDEKFTFEEIIARLESEGL
jgi:hypothetical protein